MGSINIRNSTTIANHHHHHHHLLHHPITTFIMASAHQLAIAKASLTASLLRADPAPVSRDEISIFHRLLEQTLAVCSPPNIQVATTTAAAINTTRLHAGHAFLYLFKQPC